MPARGARRHHLVSPRAPPPHCRVQQPAPCSTYSGTVGELAVHVVWNGRDAAHGVDNVGTVPAALSTYLALQAFKPDLIISAGTAGGFKAKVRAGAPALCVEAPPLDGRCTRRIMVRAAAAVQGAAIGDIFVSEAVINHDRRIPIPGPSARAAGACSAALLLGLSSVATHHEVAKGPSLH